MQTSNLEARSWWHETQSCSIQKRSPFCFQLPMASPVDSSTQGDSKSSASVDIPPDLESLSRDLGNLLVRQDIPDVTLKCGGRTISAHRAVLAARSKVFAAMFRNKLVESETGVIDVTDVDVEVFELFLQYVYSGKILSVPESLLPSLYDVAYNYAVYPLKKGCSERMIASLTEDNYLLYLTIADAQGDVAFKEAVVSFICSHEAILQSENWLRFSEKFLKLANEVYQSFVKWKSIIRENSAVTTVGPSFGSRKVSPEPEVINSIFGSTTRVRK